MCPEKSEEFTRISLKIPKELLADFSEHAKSQGYQRRDKAIIDLIQKEISKN
jgi:metal-responsive CopG/Arc/MetJ family transcriptional regulator